MIPASDPPVVRTFAERAMAPMATGTKTNSRVSIW